ncbi:MAG TPA: membrane protein insertase YidC [Candidatus Angelobacter sp.]|nr:membrane protein insertase YidC [Candidatus Angelobacter sp.]
MTENLLTEYHNPQQDPGSEKRLLLVLFISFIGIALMQFLFKAPQPQPQPKPGPEQQQTQPSPSPSGTPAARQASRATTGKVKPSIPSLPILPAKQASTATETVVENDKYRITFSNQGALVKSWILKEYKDDFGKPLDMVNPVTAPVVGYPLSFFTYDKDLQKKLNEALYVPSAVSPQKAPTSLTFEYRDGDTSAHKTFTFDASSYVLGIETEVQQDGQRVQAHPAWPGGFGDQTALPSYAGTRIDWNQNGNITRQAPQSGWFLTGGKKWVVGGLTINGPFQWVANVDQYFTAAFMPESPKDAVLVTLHQAVEIPRNLDKPNEAEKDKASVLGVAVGSANGLTRERLFLGPKAVNLLESTQAQASGPDLRGILDFGFFGFISRPLFLWLKWTHEHMISNWGWAIAFLTLVITVVLLPLRISSLKSGLKMQKIQPQIKAINEKYKRYGITDPRRAGMQQEMSELYKKEGVNPLGGCLPLLLQMPFLFAFYSMLGNAIELRQANWLWVHNLAAPDPLHILPIAIAITMFVTQKSTPQAGMDPAQQKMFAFMTPLMMGVISWSVAAGLGIYWGLSNILQWVQQTAINQTEFGKQVRKAAERRATRKK